MAYSAAGQRILITGASSGIGAALARRLAAQGAIVGLIARRRDRLAEVLADCATPGSAMWVADLADASAVDELAVHAWDALFVDSAVRAASTRTNGPCTQSQRR